METSVSGAQLRHLSGPVWVSPQIAPAQLPEIAAAGFAWLVNHRPDDEEPGQPSSDQMRAAAAGAGLSYRHAPVRGLPDDAAVRATRDALDAAADRKILMFCRSGTRSSAAWAMAERLSGADPEALRAAAAAAGYDLSRLPL